jgi:hypothetical protein
MFPDTRCQVMEEPISIAISTFGRVRVIEIVVEHVFGRQSISPHAHGDRPVLTLELLIEAQRARTPLEPVSFFLIPNIIEGRSFGSVLQQIY